MKTRTIIYWTTTALVALAFAAGGLLDFMGDPEVTATLTHLGYPAYLATLLGAWKVLGAVAIVVPGLPVLKEWAYAGIVFDLSGAAISHASVGDGVAQLAPPLALLAVAVASWALRPPSRRLVSRAANPAREPAASIGAAQPGFA